MRVVPCGWRPRFPHTYGVGRNLTAFNIFVAELAVSDIEFQIAVQDAVTKAFASKHPRTRQAYIDLATFFEGQLQRKHGIGAAQLALLTHYDIRQTLTLPK